MHDKNKSMRWNCFMDVEVKPLSICNSMEGFDMCHGRGGGGRWGSANHFACTAQIC